MPLFRVLHDFERADRSYRSRFYDPKAKRQRWLPETVRLHGGKGNVMLNEAALAYWSMLNNQNPDVMRYLLRKESGIINFGFVGYTWKIINGLLKLLFKTKDRPMMECLTFGGNVFYGTKVGNRVYVDSLLYIDQPFPQVRYFPPAQRFMTISQDGTLAQAPVGAAYTFLLARSGERLWIEAGSVADVDDNKPASAEYPKVMRVMANPRLMVRAKPSLNAEIVDRLAYGIQVEVLGTNDDGTWARIEGGWVFARYLE